MAQRQQIPKFGDWESEEIPYTIYFDNAGKGKKSGQIDQIDSHDNVEAAQKVREKFEVKIPKHDREQAELKRPTDSPTATGHKSKNNVQYGRNKLEVKPSKAPEVHWARHERRFSREEGEMRRFTESPLRHENVGRVNSPHHRDGGSSTGDTPRRIGGKNSGISSPSWERKASYERSHGLAPSTPGRSRLRSGSRGDDSPDRGPAVPKFGEWDETDPASAEGYTQIFNLVREEKNSDVGKVPSMPTETSHSNGHKQCGNDDAKGCGCFPWGKR